MTQNKSDVYIVDGNITIFLGSHPDTFKQDVLHSSLLAHLVSSSSTTLNDRFGPYRKFLGSIYWISRSNGNQTLKKQPTNLLSLVKLTLQDQLPASQIIQITNCLTSIKRLPNGSSTTDLILSKLQFNGTNIHTSNMTCIRPLLTIVCENKTIISLQASLDASHPVSISFLDESLAIEDLLSDLKIATWTAYLEEANYNNVRKKVVEKLGSKIKTDLIHVEVTQR